MKVGIIGGGHIAGIHGPLIQQQPDTEIVAIADKDTSRAKVLASSLGVNLVYSDAQTMIEETQPDVVHILVPPQYHTPLSIMAMEQGCHVLVEKPMALTTEDAQKMVEVAKKHQVKLCANHNMIFEDAVMRTKKLVADGQIGQVVSVEVCYQFDPNRYPAILQEGAEHTHWTYQMSGGPLQDLMPHPASLLMEFMSDIEAVQFIGHNRGILPQNWHDEMRVLLKSKDVLGYITVSMSERPDQVSLTIKGSRGTIEANLFNSIVAINRKSPWPRAIARGLSGFQTSLQNFNGSIDNIYKFATRQIDKTSGLSHVVNGFYQALRNHSELPISVEKGVKVVDLINRVWPTDAAEPSAISSPSINQTLKDPPTALITGASGFIGNHLIQRLITENVGIRALVRPNSHHLGRLKGLGVDIVQGELTDIDCLRESLQGIKTIFHLAAPVGSNDWQEHYQVTVEGAKNLIQLALEQQVERFVFLSSLSVHDLLTLKENSVVTENSACYANPEEMGPYVATKLEAEKLLREAYQHHNLPITIIRPGIVVGPKGLVLIPHLGYRYQDKMVMVLGKGNTVLPLTYVNNTVDAIFKASKSKEAIGQTYNLVDDGNLMVQDYLDLFIQITQAETKVVHLPYPLLYSVSTLYELGASVGLLKKGVTSRAQLERKHKTIYYDNSKAKQDLDWQMITPIEDGLVSMFNWYSKQQLN